MTGGRNPAVRGAEFERACRDYLRTCGLEVERLYGAGRSDDLGDLAIAGRTELLFDCKAHRNRDLPGWLDALELKAGPRRTPIILAKRFQHSARDAYAITNLAGLAHLIAPLL